MVKAFLLFFLYVVFCCVCVAEDPVPEEVTAFAWPQTIAVYIDDLHYDVMGNLLYIKRNIIFVEVVDWKNRRPLTQADVIEYVQRGHITVTRIITDGVV